MSIVVVGNVDPVKISKVIENGVKKNEPFEEKRLKRYIRQSLMKWQNSTQNKV